MSVLKKLPPFSNGDTHVDANGPCILYSEVH